MNFEGPTQRIPQFHVSVQRKTLAATAQEVHVSSQRKQNTAHLPHSLSYSQRRGLPKRRGGRTVTGPHSPFLLCNSIATVGPLLKTRASTGKTGITGKVNRKGIVHAICHIIFRLFHLSYYVLFFPEQLSSPCTGRKPFS